ncbi:MAG: 3-hydroxyacyl-ACP dehydratase FabZ [Rickettsiales bacterium]|jgi:3-hydroxyacyl-[acyl-carrier-protein] dehydratase|nr:3-hydroxyacyl-ACP dehydratase FabZ [Rickettsiales bacterium]
MDKPVMNIERIIKMLPHRYPFLLVDKVISVDEKEESLVALKNVTFNEPHFTGHFPDTPVMPGVLIIEALAQAAALYVLNSMNIETCEDKTVYFMSIDNAKFRQIVSPGDALHLHVKKERGRGKVWKFSGEAKVNGKLVAESLFTAMIAEK